MDARVQLVQLTEVSNDVIDTVNAFLEELSGRSFTFSRDELKELVCNPSSALFFAKVDNYIVGMLTVNFCFKPTGMCAVVDDVVVTSDFRGRGYSKFMIEQIIDIAKKNGAKSIFLTSNPSRIAANKLYSNCGFEIKETNVYVYKI